MLRVGDDAGGRLAVDRVEDQHLDALGQHCFGLLLLLAASWSAFW